MSNIPSLVDMLKSGLHFGHRTSRWHPKMKQFIFGARSGVHIIDLEKTQAYLEKALQEIKTIASRGGVILFVGTKSQAKPIIKKYAESCGMPYVTERWLGGTITNFGQIKKSIKRLKDLKDKRDKGELDKYTKMERLLIDREIEEKMCKIGGIEKLDRVPDAIFVVDIRNEKTAVLEAKTIGKKVIALCDTNVNPKNIDIVIPGNDDAVKSIEMVCRLVSEEINEGKKDAVRAAVTAKSTPVEKTIQGK